MTNQKKVVSYSGSAEFAGAGPAVLSDSDAGAAAAVVEPIKPPSPLDPVREMIERGTTRPAAPEFAAGDIPKWPGTDTFMDALDAFSQSEDIEGGAGAPDLSKGFFAKFLDHSAGEPIPTMVALDKDLTTVSINGGNFKKFCETRAGASKGKIKKKSAQPAPFINRKHALVFAATVLGRFHALSATARPDELATLSKTVEAILITVSTTFFGNRPKLALYITQVAGFVAIQPQHRLYQALCDYLDPGEEHIPAPDEAATIRSLRQLFPDAPDGEPVSEMIGRVTSTLAEHVNIADIKATDSEIKRHLDTYTQENLNAVIVLATQLLQHCQVGDPSLDLLICTGCMLQLCIPDKDTNNLAVWLIHAEIVDRILEQVRTVHDFTLPGRKRHLFAATLLFPTASSDDAITRKFRGSALYITAKARKALPRKARKIFREGLRTPSEKPTALEGHLGELTRFVTFISSLNPQNLSPKDEERLENVTTKSGPSRISDIRRHWEVCRSIDIDEWIRTVDHITNFICLMVGTQGLTLKPGLEKAYSDDLKWLIDYATKQKNLYARAIAGRCVLSVLSDIVKHKSSVIHRQLSALRAGNVQIPTDAELLAYIQQLGDAAPPVDRALEVLAALRSGELFQGQLPGE